jgi:hypothetical protein
MVESKDPRATDEPDASTVRPRDREAEEGREVVAGFTNVGPSGSQGGRQTFGVAPAEDPRVATGGPTAARQRPNAGWQGASAPEPELSGEQMEGEPLQRAPRKPGRVRVGETEWEENNELEGVAEAQAADNPPVE